VDVLVAGGGPAGLAAAIASARCGMKTLLVEKNGWLGGMATSGLVHPFMPCYAGDRPINKGIFWEVIERLVKLNGVIHPESTRMETGYSGFVVWPHAHVTPFDSELLKWVILDLIEEAGSISCCTPLWSAHLNKTEWLKGLSLKPNRAEWP